VMTTTLPFMVVSVRMRMNRGRSHHGQQSFRMCAALAEIDRDDTGMNADEAQHLLRLVAHIICAICHSHASRLPLDHRLQNAHWAAGVGRLK
jgi:hypothetical protein